MSILALWFSMVVATIPGEGQEKSLAWRDAEIWPAAYFEFAYKEKPKSQMVSLHHRLFAGRNNPRTLLPESLFWNILVLPDFDLYEALKIDDPKKLAWKKHLVNLRGRHLESAVLWRANLTKADLSYAWLQGASFENAQLQGASLDLADLQGASLDRAKLQGASLVGAHLQRAYIDYAQLQGASLEEADLYGASLDRAWLQGASPR